MLPRVIKLATYFTILIVEFSGYWIDWVLTVADPGIPREGGQPLAKIDQIFLKTAWK